MQCPSVDLIDLQKIFNFFLRSQKVNYFFHPSCLSLLNRFGFLTSLVHLAVAKILLKWCPNVLLNVGWLKGQYNIYYVITLWFSEIWSTHAKISHHHYYIRLIARLFQQVRYSHDLTILLQPCVINLVTFLLYHDCIKLVKTTL